MNPRDPFAPHATSTSATGARLPHPVESLARTQLPSARSPALSGAAEVVDLVRRLADSQGRDDVASELSAIRERLAVAPIPIVVIGAGGQGKSSVVNALVGAPICPTGTGGCTAAPAFLAHSPGYGASLVTDPSPTRPGAGPSAVTWPYAEAIALLTEQGNPGNRWRVRLVDLGVPSSMLHRGLALIDTPAIADPWDPASLRYLSAFGGAGAVVLVSSAASELTAGELDLLRAAGSLCHRLIVVVNGTNAYPHWNRVVERDLLLLDQRGVQAELFAVDASPYWSPAGGLPPGPDPGMQDLARYLAETVVLESEQHRISRALTEAFWAADRLRMRLLAEHELIGDDDAIESTTARLRAAAHEAMDLCGPDAGWARLIGEGIRQLRRDIEDDLQHELRRLRTEAAGLLKGVVDQPSWIDAQLRLHGRLADAVVHLQRLRKLALRALARNVSDSFLDASGRLLSSLDMAPEAHALLFPRLDLPALTSRVSLADLALHAPGTPPSSGQSMLSGDVFESWLLAIENFVRSENDRIITAAHHDLEAVYITRGIELHRSIIEVLTALTLLRGLDPSYLVQRREALSSDLQQLKTLNWRLAGSPDDTD